MAGSTPFRFKQFSVSQTRAAMKVGVDGVLLGAWADIQGYQRILDVGTGTGLVALMLAQRSPPTATIHAIDIDQRAVEDAAENFSASPWSNRLSIEHTTLQDFIDVGEQAYDLIVCNPPFFAGPASDDVARRYARHSNSLPLPALFFAGHRLLRARGRLVVIVPIQLEKAMYAEARQSGWQTCRALFVRPLVGRPVHRLLTEFSRESAGHRVEELTIEITHHQYTDSFRDLTRDFYLAF